MEVVSVVVVCLTVATWKALALRYMKPPLSEKTINIYVSGISKSDEAQQTRRLIFAKAFSIAEVSQGCFFREPADGVL